MKNLFILKEILKERKITSQELSDMTGIPLGTISEYRSNRRKEPSLSNGLKIADALHIDPHELFSEAIFNDLADELEKQCGDWQNQPDTEEKKKLRERIMAEVRKREENDR